MAKKIKCPKCKGTRIVALDTKKKLSAKKGIIGAVITLPFSAPVTAAGAAVGALSGGEGLVVERGAGPLPCALGRAGRRQGLLVGRRRGLGLGVRAVVPAGAGRRHGLVVVGPGVGGLAPAVGVGVDGDLDLLCLARRGRPSCSARNAARPSRPRSRKARCFPCPKPGPVATTAPAAHRAKRA